MSAVPPPPGPQDARQAPALLSLTSQQLSTALFVLAGLFAAIPIGLLLSRGGFQQAVGPVFWWGCVLAAIALCGGVFEISYVPTPGVSEADKARYLLVTLGGAAGLATVLLGAWLALSTYYTQLFADLESWRSNPRPLVYTGLAVLGGLVLMFLALRLIAGEERTSQTARRLVHGYTAVLGGLLLLIILGVVNVLAYANPFARYLGRTSDWTQHQIYTLKPATKDYLSRVPEPVTVYVLLPASHPLVREVTVLLNNCRAVNPNIRYEVVHTGAIRSDNQEDPPSKKLIPLMLKYSLNDPSGLLVVMGREEAEPSAEDIDLLGKAKGKKARQRGKETWEFIPVRSLLNGQPRMTADYTFTGEQALMNALSSLVEGKAVIYFTQGHGEPSLNRAMPKMPFGRPPPEGGESMERIKDFIRNRKGFEVKELPLSTGTTRVPADASVVCVIAPKRTIPRQAAAALEAFVKGKGKLFIALDPVREKKGTATTMVPTGLEGLFAKYGVRVGNDVVLRYKPYPRTPVTVTFAAFPARSQNPIAQIFERTAEGRARPYIPFNQMRSVSPASPGGRGGATVETLLEADEPIYWAEDNLSADPQARAEAVAKDEGRVRELEKAPPVSLAVTVSEGAPGMPGDSFHSPARAPKMIVYGNGSWLTDREVLLHPAYGPLFNASLSWLREKPPMGKVAEARQAYDLGIKPDNRSRLAFLPLLLMLFTVVGLGVGAWVVRRR